MIFFKYEIEPVFRLNGVRGTLIYQTNKRQSLAPLLGGRLTVWLYIFFSEMDSILTFLYRCRHINGLFWERYLSHMPAWRSKEEYEEGS